MNVLVVEDQLESRTALCELLGLWGHRTTGAANGADALERAGSGAPDLILVDIGLPDMDGFELARRLRERVGSTVRLVAMTGQVRERSASGSVHPFDAYLVKPVDMALLSKLLDGD